MFRILSASKDNYITDKYIAGARSIDANVGRASTLDLFKLYNETYVAGTSSVSGTYEKSRILIQFPIESLGDLTSSGKINIADASFKCFLSMKDVYGGQTTPTNFTLRLAPLSKSWDEGRGYDVIAFRDLDSSNYITASVVGGIPSLWNVQGAGASGVLGATNIDIIVSGNLGSGMQDLTVSQIFSLGNEDLYMDVTKLVSGTLVGLLPNCGWRISFIDTEEYDQVTRFVKRFGSRHAINKHLRPRLFVKYNDALLDDTGELEFNSPQKVMFYNRINGLYTNFTSGSIQITGSNCAILRLYASKSISYITNSFSISHNAHINHLTKSMVYFSQSFSASQAAIGGIVQTGIYSASVDLNIVTNTTLATFLSNSNKLNFKYDLLSLDGTYSFASGYYTFRKPLAYESAVPQRNWIVNITNLKDIYHLNDIVKFRVFVQDYDADIEPGRVPTKTYSVILKNMKWRVVEAFSRKIYIPFDSMATLCSTDSDGMYYTCYMSDFEPGEVYEFEFCITENGQDYYINNRGFRFKVMP